MLLGGQVLGWLKIQASWVRSAPGRRGFEALTAGRFLKRWTRQDRGFGGLCQCRKHCRATARSNSGKGSSAKAGLDPPAQGPRPPSSPAQRGPRAPGIFGATRAVSSRASALRAPRAPTASGGDVWASAPEREGATQPRPGFGHVRPATLAGGRIKWPNLTSPCALGRKRGAPAGARGRRRPFHTRPGFLLFLTAHQGKAEFNDII